MKKSKGRKAAVIAVGTAAVVGASAAITHHVDNVKQAGTAKKQPPVPTYMKVQLPIGGGKGGTGPPMGAPVQKLKDLKKDVGMKADDPDAPMPVLG